MTVIYVDSLFLINTLVDYLLLLVTGRLAGIPLQRIRYFTAAVLGGLYAVIAVMPTLNFLNTSPIKLLIWLLISLIAYGFSNHYIKLTLLFGMTACVLAGIVLVLGLFLQKSSISKISIYPRTTWLILIVSLMICVLIYRPFQSFMHSKIQKTVVHAELSIAGKSSTLVTLLDTGNCLKDTVTGHPILIVSSSILDVILPKHLSTLLSSKNLQQPLDIPVLLHETEPVLCPKLIPYRALGLSSGVLLTIRSDWVKINGTKLSHISIALAPTPLGFGYSALWGGEI